jgi:hypothetical protein
MSDQRRGLVRFPAAPPANPAKDSGRNPQCNLQIREGLVLDVRLHSECCCCGRRHFLEGRLPWQIRCVRRGTEVGFGCDGPKSEIPLHR